MKVLCLSLKAKWYDMIESGLKTEEYREIKPYWINRLLVDAEGKKLNNLPLEVYPHYVNIVTSELDKKNVRFVSYTHVRFSYGYTKKTMTFEVKGISIGRGKCEWGAPAEYVFRIALGSRISSPTGADSAP